MLRSTYTVVTYPAHEVDPIQESKRQTKTDWRWLNIYDTNGAGVHSTIVREKDLPQEIAVAIERAVMSSYEDAQS